MNYEDWEDCEENYMPSIKLILECNQEFIDEEIVKFINIEEDSQGQDVLTFECPECSEIHQSLRYG